MRWIAAFVLVVTACRSSSFDDCEVTCTAASGCPDGLTCGSEGRCRPAGATGSCREVLDDAGGGTTREVVLETRATTNRNLDLLFVIDNSPSMAAKQTLVKTALPVLFAELAALDGELPSLHIGVISTDLGTKGSGSATPAPAIGTVGNGGCASVGDGGKLLVKNVTLPGTFVSDIEGTPRLKNYTGDLSTFVGSMLTLGATGCGFEQHLQSLRVALSNNIDNVGFVRAGATLGIIIVSDEDDCSVLDPGFFGPAGTALGTLQSFRCFRFGVECAPDDPASAGAKASCKSRVASTLNEDIAPFQTFLAGLKSDPRDVMLALLGGAATPVAVELRAPTGSTVVEPAVKHTCDFLAGGLAADADPPIRLAQLLQSFTGRSRLESLCSADVSPQVRSVGKTARALIGDPCLAKPIAAQHDCVVEDTQGSLFQPVRACSASVTDDCFELVADPALCTEHDHLKLVVHRSTPAPAGTYTVVRCSVGG